MARIFDSDEYTFHRFETGMEFSAVKFKRGQSFLINYAPRGGGFEGPFITTGAGIEGGHHYLDYMTAEEEAKPCKDCGRIGPPSTRSSPHMGRCGTCGRDPIPDEIIIERATSKELEAVLKYLNKRLSNLNNDGPASSLDDIGTTRWAIYYAAKAELRATILQLKSGEHH